MHPVASILLRKEMENGIGVPEEVATESVQCEQKRGKKLEKKKK